MGKKTPAQPRVRLIRTGIETVQSFEKETDTLDLSLVDAFALNPFEMQGNGDFGQEADLKGSYKILSGEVDIYRYIDILIYIDWVGGLRGLAYRGCYLLN